MSSVFLRKDRIPNEKEDGKEARRGRVGSKRQKKDWKREKCKTNLIFTGKNSRGFCFCVGYCEKVTKLRIIYVCMYIYFFIVGPSRRVEHWRDGGILKFCVFSVRIDRGASEGCALCEERSLLRAVLL